MPPSTTSSNLVGKAVVHNLMLQSSVIHSLLHRKEIADVGLDVCYKCPSDIDVYEMGNGSVSAEQELVSVRQYNVGRRECRNHLAA